MINTAFLVVAALAFAAALIKAASMLRPRREPGQGLLLTLLLTLAVTCFALSDKVQYQEDRLYHDLGRLLSNVTTMIAAFAILALLMTLSLPLPEARPKVRRRLLALAVCVTGMAVSFTAASPLPETLGDFGSLYDTRPELLVYITLFVAFLGTALAELLVLAWRYARLARRRPYLRGGLMLMCAGSVLGLVYLAEKTVYVITQVAHWPPPFASDRSCSSLLTPPQCAFSITLPITAVLLAALGATLPVWGPALTAPFRYYRNWRFFHALEPLWQRLCDEFPQITLPEQDKRTSRPDLAFRLYRRIIEIDDCRLLLRPYLSPAITMAAGEAATAHGLRGQDLRATIEAAEIAAALRARQADSPVPAESPPERTDSRTSDVSREAAWLARVARAYATSPVVQDLPALR